MRIRGVYSDEIFTGTKEERAGLHRMMVYARTGKLDLILTKSISRFARNTMTLLSAVMELKGLGVDVYFEEQRIHNISGEGVKLFLVALTDGNYLDNSKTENFFSKLKKELFYGHEKEFHNFAEFQKAIDEYIEWYNNERIVERLGGAPVCNRSIAHTPMLCYSSI